MNQIVNLKLNNNEVVIVQLSSGKILSFREMYLDMALRQESFFFIKGNGDKVDIKFNNDGTKITEPPLEVLKEFDNL